MSSHSIHVGSDESVKDHRTQHEIDLLSLIDDFEYKDKIKIKIKIEKQPTENITNDIQFSGS